ncbi:MAG: glycoside hydrolase family 3 N-terminal domain-containing protein [Anaerolineaceae bacterium]
MKRIVPAIFALIFILNLILPAISVEAANIPSRLEASEKANQLLAKMTPEQKVGQLFLVSFKGTDISANSQIYDLVVNKHVGGVVLEQANDNFVGPDNTIKSTQDLILGLQKNALEGQPESSNSQTPIQNHVPLFIGISQEGDGDPFDQIINGITPLADAMSIGATWRPVNAETTGRILGLELKALGFNLLFGPSLDVLDSVRTVDSEDLSVRTFGGDPYWVGEMGKAFIKGVHEGSSGHLAVIAKNFPGRGSADRPAEDEVATVRKSLEQLKQIELAPFFAVTGNVSDPLEQTDGLLVSHIRYQGFQGNIRATTKPISLDSTALEQILSLSSFVDWRIGGGIIVSDNLGTTSIQKFFDPTGKSFDARQVAKTAFLAGNDLLYLGNIVSAGDADSYTSVVKIIDLFLQKYQEDPAFATRVDEAVLRLLTLKFKLYPSFNALNIYPVANDLDMVGTSAQATFEVASEAITLISPAVADLDGVLTNAPQATERLVFISDTISAKQCSTCAEQTIFSAQDFRNSVVKLYGPSASEEIQGYRISAYSFGDLQKLIDQTGDITQLQDDLASADWIIFSVVGENQTAIGQEVLRRFLSEKSDLLRNKKVIGFAFNAPYYLDATDISKLTAYYGVYGKTTPFIDVAARVLFQELVPSGSSPVSITGVGYDIITATTPDPEQIIQLMVDNGDQVTATSGTSSLTPTSVLIYNVGDTLSIKTGIIVDHNGHPVPDGTVVRFIIDTGSTSGTGGIVETTTSSGVAKTAYRIQSKGLLGITVQAEPAIVSQTLSLDITDAGGVLTAIEPTAIPKDTQTSITETATPLVTANLRPDLHTEGLPTAGDWLLSTILIIGLSAALYWLGSIRASIQWGIRWAALACIGGYAAYLYLVLGLPGSAYLISVNGTVVVALISIVGVILGWAAAGVWWGIAHNKSSNRN